jgi:hypothetical protein
MSLNDKMTIQMALDELEITELTKVDNEYIKKQYHRLALKIKIQLFTIIKKILKSTKFK